MFAGNYSRAQDADDYDDDDHSYNNYSYGPAPVCTYGYYAYPPYTCAPYGYWGPDYFVGIFPMNSFSIPQGPASYST